MSMEMSRTSEVCVSFYGDRLALARHHQISRGMSQRSRHRQVLAVVQNEDFEPFSLFFRRTWLLEIVSRQGSHKCAHHVRD